MEEIHDLVERARASGADSDTRQSAFGMLVYRFQNMAYGCAYAVLGDFHQAEDAAQEAFIDAYLNLDKLENPKAFPGWLRRIVIGECHRTTRIRRYPTVSLDHAGTVPSDEPDPLTAVEIGEARTSIREAVAALPESQRMVTALYYLSGYAQHEIAAFLELPLATVKKRLQYARKRLKERMLPMAEELFDQTRPSRNENFARQVAERLQTVDKEVAGLQAVYADGDTETRRMLLEEAHSADRFENYDPEADAISEADARLLLANRRGFAFWKKYESYLHLLPPVVTIIEAIDAGDEAAIQSVLTKEPTAANPQWADGYKPVEGYIYPNDSIPLFRVSQAYWDKHIDRDTSYRIAKMLLDAGAEPDFAHGLPLASAVSFNALGVVEALLDGGAAVDGVDGDGVPMAYPLHFGFTQMAEYLAERGATLDLRFAAGLGKLDMVKTFFDADGAVKPDVLNLSDPYGHERKREGKSPIQADRTPQNMLRQAMYFAGKHARLETVTFLIDYIDDINAVVPGLDGEVPVLHHLCLFSGAPSGDAAGQGMTTTEQRLLPVIRFLLDHGADPRVEDPVHHATALDWARHADPSSEAVITLLEARM